MPTPNQPDGIERRYGSEAIELRFADGAPPLISGHAAVFNSLSEDLGGFREQIAPGAFANSLKDDIRALFNHDARFVLGRSTSGTLRLAEDAKGLAVEIDPPDTQDARDLLTKMKRGDITGMSFGFRTVKDAWAEVDGKIIRTLVEVRVFDVSIVTYPAYPDAGAAVRSLESWRAERAPKPPDFTLMRRRLDLLAL